ncbi:CPBP family intramembrane glutamic endopeptidase [Kribbella sp. NPDC048915]|uniref:CPBP family intramembrane glutamic endopeptidase n=1 Tax=Kribbella sp. NPDC048915 TaxID=3155148 RepID=UPI0034083B3E
MTVQRASGSGTFTVVLFLLSLPVWVLASFVEGPAGAPMGIPLSALQFPMPLLAALILERRDRGPGAARRLFRTLLRLPPAGVRWWAIAVLLIPGLVLGAGVVHRLAGSPGGSLGAPLSAVPLLFLLFLPAGLAEELGWMGFAYGRFREDRGHLYRALVLGVIWAAWHLVPLMQAGRAATWILAWTVGSVALRVLIVWIYLDGGRTVLLPAVMHTMVNVSESVYPDMTSPGSMTAVAAGFSVAAVPAARRLARLGASGRAQTRW